MKPRSFFRLFFSFSLLLFFLNGCGDPAKALYVEANNLELTRVYSRAIPKYEDIIKKYPKSRYAVLAELGIANCYKGIGENEKAIELYDQFNFKHADDSLVKDALWNKAEVYRNIGENEKAVTVYKELIKKFPDCDYAEEAKQFIALIGEISTHEDNAEVQASGSNTLVIEQLEVPTRLSIGEKGILHVVIKNISQEPLNDTKIQTELKYWKGIKVGLIKPNPIQVQEFWGIRVWEYDKIINPGDKFEVVAEIIGDKPGKYESNLMVEANLEDSGIKRAFSTEVVP